MTWIYQRKLFSEISTDYEGFVYLITNKKTKRKYVGKKTFWFRAKNRKTGRRQKKESDWKTYYGSSDELKNDVNVLGKEYFKREILYLCKTKKSMTYYETYEQFKRDVLRLDEYYNTNISGKFYSKDLLL